MASKSSPVIDTASVTYTFENFKSITSYSYTTNFYSAITNKQLELRLGILPRPSYCPQNVILHLYHDVMATNEPVNIESEISILNATNEKCYTKNYNYQCIFDQITQLCSCDTNETNFILYDELIKEENGFIRNDALTLFCEVKILDVPILEKNPVLSKMCKDFQSILTTGEHSDFVLVVGDKEFKVHKNILAARSSVFKAMLSADLVEKKTNRVEIVDVDVDVFEQLLNYIYSCSVAKLDEYTLELFIAADKYQLEELKSICGQSLGSNLTVETVTNILLLADMHNAPDLKVNCIKFITANSAKVMATDGWKQLRLELVNELYHGPGVFCFVVNILSSLLVELTTHCQINIAYKLDFI